MPETRSTFVSSSGYTMKTMNNGQRQIFHATSVSLLIDVSRYKMSTSFERSLFCSSLLGFKHMQTHTLYHELQQCGSSKSVTVPQPTSLYLHMDHQSMYMWIKSRCESRSFMMAMSKFSLYKCTNL